MKNRYSCSLRNTILGVALGLPLFCSAQAIDSIREFTIDLYDTGRGRIVPLALYTPPPANRPG